ncbi:MAG: hypothetical protein AMXMBFR66_07360 [Pseudomonadota bacterium]|nr:patatin-like phospholipase family protein [Rubrivivax sp.]
MPAKPSAAAARGGDAPTALVLQGGGALGAYQAGAYEALALQGERVSWVVGISIGAINAALIAGNRCERRVERLRAFWERVSVALLPSATLGAWFAPMRRWWDDGMAMLGAWQGIEGFFRPRPPWAWWPRAPVSVYDTAPLRETLRELVDFDLLDNGPVRLSVGAVDVESGNFIYFDNRQQAIGAEHIMASGALPPGLPPVRVGERWYRDGGIVSNTPLAHVLATLETGPDAPVTIFQVDLFNARGALPQTILDAAEREKDIRFSSRTRMVSDRLRERHQLRRRLRELAAWLPQTKRTSPAVRSLLAETADPPITLVHVIHRHKPYETQTKDYEFSRLSMCEHWAAGVADMAASLQLLQRQPAIGPGEFRVLDRQADTPPRAYRRADPGAPDDRTNAAGARRTFETER